jgi:hypothetical protein
MSLPRRRRRSRSRHGLDSQVTSAIVYATDSSASDVLGRVGGHFLVLAAWPSFWAAAVSITPRISP